MKLLLIRHGMTKGNLEHRYVGSTDEGLLPEEKDRLREMRLPGGLKIEKVFISPMLRCRDTLECLFPEVVSDNEEIVVRDFREMEFGDFEYMNYKEINEDSDPEHKAAYQRYIDSMGESPFPGGESKSEFTERVVSAFEKEVIAVIRNSSKSAFALVVHGGTIMALMDKYSEPHKDYFDWGLKPGQGYEAEISLDSEGEIRFKKVKMWS
ncbi:histidine phosphatase family protein [Oribacterium sp. C9]|uniref:histidine phosphatase family protein n=1 Tax=Oribacterium sp. C9 TaxID=1943579 RepID=UPI00098ECD78|nr:histidine phosphatase family protein [Oribacterium sp. C9]